MHTGHSECPEMSFRTLYRVDMEDNSGTPMCEECSNDAYGSGLFDEEPAQ